MLCSEDIEREALWSTGEYQTRVRKRDYMSRGRQMVLRAREAADRRHRQPRPGRSIWWQPRWMRAKYKQAVCLEWLHWFCGHSRCSPNRQTRGDSMREISSSVLIKDGHAKGWEETPSPPTAWGAQGSLMALWQHSSMHRIQHGCLQAALKDS